MAAEISTFGFDSGDSDIKGGQMEKYKGKKGEAHRCAIIYTDPKTMFAGSRVHYKERFFLCKKGKCCDLAGPAKWRVGGVLVKYGTDKQGTMKKPFSYELFPWIFSEGTYTKLKGINTEFPLATHDIKITCDNDDFQHLNINPCQESIWTARDELKAEMLEAAKPIWDYIKRSIASDLTIDEIMALCGSAPAGGSSDPSSQINLDDVLNKV